MSSPSNYRAALIALALVALPAAAQNAGGLGADRAIPPTPDPVGAGARAAGMSNAFIAIADDATAASWNPASLVQLERPEIAIVGSLLTLRPSSNPSTASSFGSTFGSTVGSTFGSTFATTSPTGAGVGRCATGSALGSVAGAAGPWQAATIAASVSIRLHVLQRAGDVIAAIVAPDRRQGPALPGRCRR